MPYLTQDEIETISKRVVAAYWKLPVHRGKSCWYIDPELLATNLLGLRMEYHTLSLTGNVHGLTAYGEVDAQIYDDPKAPAYFHLDGKTILVEKELMENYARFGRWHFTVAHEASHQIYKMLYPREYLTAARYRTIHYYTTSPPPRDWDEWRTDVLASAILMPEETLRWNMADAGLHEGLGMLHRASRDYFPFCQVAGNMGVSRAALALRMKRLGMLDSYYFGDPNDLITA